MSHSICFAWVRWDFRCLVMGIREEKHKMWATQNKNSLNSLKSQVHRLINTITLSFIIVTHTHTKTRWSIDHHITDSTKIATSPIRSSITMKLPFRCITLVKFFQMDALWLWVVSVLEKSNQHISNSCIAIFGMHIQKRQNCRAKCELSEKWFIDKERAFEPHLEW